VLAPAASTPAATVGRGVTVPNIPNLYILGAPKCGTTALCTYLRRHPDIFMPPKEMHYFGSDLVFRNKPRITRQEYLSRYETAAGERYRGDSAIWYLYSERAAAEIAEARPDARCLALLRRPDDMVDSLHSEFLYQGDEDIPDLGAALDAEADRRHGDRIPETCDVPWALQYRQVARYADQVARYLSVFPREQLRVVLYDDLESDTAGAYRDILRFLGVEDTFQPEFAVVNSNKKVRSPGFRQALRHPPSPVRRLVRATVRDQRVRRALGQRLVDLNTDVVPRARLDPSVRALLMAAYADQVAGLAELIGRDLSAWTVPPPAP
jgi:hypothetical protein